MSLNRGVFAFGLVLCVSVGYGEPCANYTTTAAPRTKIVVTNRSVSPCNGSQDCFYYRGMSEITLNLPPCVASVNIVMEDVVDHITTTLDMPKIILTGGPGASDPPVAVTLGFAFNQGDLPPTKACVNWGGLNTASLAHSQFYGGISGSLTGELTLGDSGAGGTNLGELFRFDASGAINAPIAATNSGSSGVCVIEAASITGTGSLVLKDDVITRVKTTGNLAGQVTATNGSIANIEVGGNLTGAVRAENGGITGTLQVAGDIIVADLPGGVFPIRTKTGINRLIARSVDTNIAAAVNSGAGRVGLFKTTSGAMSKTLICKELSTISGGGESGVVIHGSLTGNVRLFAGSPNLQPIWIRDSLTGEIRYDDPADLSNQIIVNGGNTGGVWSGKVIMNFPSNPNGPTLWANSSQPDQAPHYERPSASLGGGAVGLVPYRLYAGDCFPIHHDDWVVPSGEPHLLNSQFNGDVSGQSPQSVKMRFYGPVRTNASAPTQPIAVWLWLHGSQWADVTSTLDVIVKRGSDSGLSREIEIKRKPDGTRLAPG